MKTIGIRELKSRLSEIIKDVTRGDSYLVTDRGTVVAELRRPELESRNMSPNERALARLAAEGHLRLATKRGYKYPRSPLRMPDGTAARFINEDRGE